MTGDGRVNPNITDEYPTSPDLEEMVDRNEDNQLRTEYDELHIMTDYLNGDTTEADSET